MLLPYRAARSRGPTRVRTFKRDYVRVNLTPDARTVLEQLPRWLTHYNKVHPHNALGYRSPREYIIQSRELRSGN